MSLESCLWRLLRCKQYKNSEKRGAGCHLGSAVQANGGICCFTQGIHSDGQRTFGSQDSGDLALELGGCLADEGRMIDEAVLGSLVLCLQCPG